VRSHGKPREPDVSCEADEPTVELRSWDVYTHLSVVLRCLYTSWCKSTHSEPRGSRVERSHGELWGYGLEAYFRSAVMITDREVSWRAKRTWCWGHFSVGCNDRWSWGLMVSKWIWSWSHLSDDHNDHELWGLMMS